MSWESDHIFTQLQVRSLPRLNFKIAKQTRQQLCLALLDTLVAEGVTRTDLALNWIQSTLSPQPGRARVGILITDGHPTTDRGEIVQEVISLMQIAEAIAADGISLCTVGLGDAGDFNSALLVNINLPLLIAISTQKIIHLPLSLRANKTDSIISWFMINKAVLNPSFFTIF